MNNESKLILTGQFGWFEHDGILTVDHNDITDMIQKHFDVERNDKGFYWMTDPQHLVRITIERIDDLNMEHAVTVGGVINENSNLEF